jgi:hypothetical protein
LHLVGYILEYLEIFFDDDGDNDGYDDDDNNNNNNKYSYTWNITHNTESTAV